MYGNIFFRNLQGVFLYFLHILSDYLYNVDSGAIVLDLDTTVFEFVNSYSSMKSAADSYGSPSNDNGHWNEDRYLLSFFTGKPSYILRSIYY